MFRQVSAITAINIKSIPERWASSLVIVVGIAGVVAVFTALLAMAAGFESTLKASGRALILCGAREQPLHLIQGTEFEELLGKENLCENVQEALQRAEEAFERLQPAGADAAR